MYYGNKKEETDTSIVRLYDTFSRVKKNRWWVVDIIIITTMIVPSRVVMIMTRCYFFVVAVVVVCGTKIGMAAAVEGQPRQQVNRNSDRFIRTKSTNWIDIIRMHHDESTSHVTDEVSSSLTMNTGRDLEATTANTVNPYTSGCLHAKELVSHIRVCNSEDPLDASASGICRSPEVDYMEIRIFSDNWESITFEAWILQIILSELLDVPTTIEAGSYEGSLNFYHPDAPMEYGTPLSDNDALKFAYGIGDCRKANKDSVDHYEACAHFDPERWTGAYYHIVYMDIDLPTNS